MIIWTFQKLWSLLLFPVVDTAELYPEIAADGSASYTENVLLLNRDMAYIGSLLASKVGLNNSDRRVCLIKDVEAPESKELVESSLELILVGDLTPWTSGLEGPSLPSAPKQGFGSIFTGTP